MSLARLGLTAWTLVLAAVGSAPAADDVKVVKEGVLDEIHLKVASIPSGSGVHMVPFSTEGADLGTGGENAEKATRSDAAKEMVKIGPDLLADSFHAAVVEGGKLRATADPTPAALVVEGRFLKIDPGSKAKRYWGSFGAGKSGIQVTGTVKDASGRVLAEFTHTRHSGIGIGGGDYVKFLSDDTRDVGKDIARFLLRWAAGQDLQKN